MSDLAARVTARVRELVDADGRTQLEIACAAWPELEPESALRRLVRARSGAWMPAGTAEAIARGLAIDPGEFYRSEP